MTPFEQLHHAVLQIQVQLAEGLLRLDQAEDLLSRIYYATLVLQEEALTALAQIRTAAVTTLPAGARRDEMKGAD